MSWPKHEVYKSVLANAELDQTNSTLKCYPKSTRRLLESGYFKELADMLTHRLPCLENLTPIQATYFLKTNTNNWFVAPHQDLQVPVSAHHNNQWTHPTIKEDIPFIQPPRRVLLTCRAARLQLDPPGAGDLCLHDGLEAFQPQIPRGGALTFSPLQVHSSHKLPSDSPPRRVVHILYGPRCLEPPYAWYEFTTKRSTNLD